MIFLGAGASARFGIPTSPDLTREIGKIIRKNNPRLLDSIRKFLDRYNKNFNYENILTVLTALTNPDEVNRDHYSHLFVDMYPHHKGDYAEIISKMYEAVCNCCTAPFSRAMSEYLEPERLESIFEITYDPLIGVPLQRMSDVGKGQLIFSTNYDPSIELWCQKRFLKCIDGTIQINNPEINQVRNSTDHLEEVREVQNRKNFEEIPLIRLHGSVWTYELPSAKMIKFNVSKDRLAFSDLYHDLIRQKPVLIFPGQEERLRRAQWDPLYQFFKERLTDDCLFIGYSFRHDVINEPILDNLENERIKKLGVLAPNPKKNFANLFQERRIPKDKIIEMPAKFGDSDAIAELGFKWIPHMLGLRYTQKGAFLRNASNWKKGREKRYVK